MKTEASRKPIPMEPGLAEVLQGWRTFCAYNQPQDYVFASPNMDGKQPLWPNSAMEKHICPAGRRSREAFRLSHLPPFASYLLDGRTGKSRCRPGDHAPQQDVHDPVLLALAGARRSGTRKRKCSNASSFPPQPGKCGCRKQFSHQTVVGNLCAIMALPRNRGA